jgi:hypothetical protein
VRRLRRRIIRVTGGGSAYAGPLLSWDQAFFTRPLEGCYQSNPGGLMAFAGVNVRREGYDFGELLTLIESQRTNYAIRSEDFSGWSPATVTLVPNSDTAPDGQADVTEVQFASGTGARLTLQSAAFTNGMLATISRWVKNVSGDGSTRLQIVQRDGATEVSLPSTATGSFVREALRAASVGTGVSSPSFWNRNGAVAAARNVRIWGVQWEMGRYETSYIRTNNGSVERDADQATWAPQEVPLLLRAQPFKFRAASWHANTDLASGDVRVLCSFVGPDDVLRIRHTGAAVALEAVVGGVVKATQNITYARRTPAEVTVDPVTGRVGFGGIWGSAGTPWAWPTGHFRLGGEVGGTNEYDGGLSLPETL